MQKFRKLKQFSRQGWSMESNNKNRVLNHPTRNSEYNDALTRSRGLTQNYPTERKDYPSSEQAINLSKESQLNHKNKKDKFKKNKNHKSAA
jgi:hypothetical protein